MQHNSSFGGSNEGCLIQVLIKPDKASLKLAMSLFIDAISLLVQHSLGSSPSPHVSFRFYYYNNNKQQKYCFPLPPKCHMFLVLFLDYSVPLAAVFIYYFVMFEILKKKNMILFLQTNLSCFTKYMHSLNSSCSTSCSYPIIHLTQTRSICL